MPVRSQGCMPRSFGQRECGANIRHVVTVACDTPFLPDDLVARFLAALEEQGANAAWRARAKACTR